MVYGAENAIAISLNPRGGLSHTRKRIVLADLSSRKVPATRGRDVLLATLSPQHEPSYKPHAMVLLVWCFPASILHSVWQVTVLTRVGSPISLNDNTENESQASPHPDAITRPTRI